METNVISFLLTDEEKEECISSANALLRVSEKLPDLSTESRRYYGSVNEQNKLVINKTRDLVSFNPKNLPTEVDWVEFEKDYQARLFFGNLLDILKNVVSRVESAKMMHDYDNYNDALTYYRYLDYMRRSGAPGAEANYNALKEFFTRAKTSKPTPTTNNN